MIQGVKVMHFLPGRLRLRIAALKGAPELGARVERELACVPGIRRVEAKPATGSVLLEYDGAMLRSGECVGMLRCAARRLLAPHDALQLERYLDRLR